jgi:hypothetical protein
MSVSKTAREEIKSRLLTIPPKVFTSACVYQLDRLFKAAEEQNLEITVKSWWENPYQTYQYVVRHRFVEYFLHEFSNYNELFLAQALNDIRTGGLYFTLANWLDWANEYDLHNRYNTPLNFKKTTGWVLKHPVPIMAAAASISNAYMPEMIHLIDMPFRREACQLASDKTRAAYPESVMPKSLMEEAMHAAHLSLNDVAGCKINGYPK